MSTTAAVLGAAAARESLGRLGGYDEIVVLEPSVNELERLLVELADPRLDYLLGELPVLPLPDASVDLKRSFETNYGSPDVSGGALTC